jgi:hypothetical protein
MMKTAPATLLLSAALAGTASAQDRPAEWTPPATDEATGQICHLQYYHLGHAEPVDLTGTQCSAWSDNACCTFSTADAFKYDQADISGLYDGHGMGISQCGIPSQACQKWMIAENCLYECDVNAGRYRHHVGDAACDDAAGGNDWQISGFPVKVFPFCLPARAHCLVLPALAPSAGGFLLRPGGAAPGRHEPAPLSWNVSLTPHPHKARGGH